MRTIMYQHFWLVVYEHCNITFIHCFQQKAQSSHNTSAFCKIKRNKRKQKRWIQSSTHSHTQAGLIPNTSPQLTGLALQYLQSDVLWEEMRETELVVQRKECLVSLCASNQNKPPKQQQSSVRPPLVYRTHTQHSSRSKTADCDGQKRARELKMK